MTIEKSNKSFYDLTKHSLSNSSELNLYPIMFDSAYNEHFLNIFRVYVINEDVHNSALFYLTHDVDDSDWFDTIANEYYETSYLWWVIPLFNNMANPFEDLEPGDNLKILRREYLYQLLKEMSMVSSM